MNIQLPQYITGPYAVGTETFSLTDTSRQEVLGPGKGPRRIAVRMYYPAPKEAVAGMQKAPIFSDTLLTALLKSFRMKEMPQACLTAEYYLEASHVPEQKFPLIMYNHGYTGYIEGNTYLCCELASNGFIVASLGHAYEAVANVYDDGSCDLYDTTITRKMNPHPLRSTIAQLRLMKAKGTPAELYARFDTFQKKHEGYIMERLPQWAADTLYVVEDLRKRYADYIDFSKGIAATGHSFGGATAYYLCQHGDVITCGANIDGGLFGDYTGMTMNKPFLQIGCPTSYNVETKALLDTTAPVVMETFEDMTHVGFTDAKFYFPRKIFLGKMPGVEMHRRLAKCHLDFFEQYLKQ